MASYALRRHGQLGPIGFVSSLSSLSLKSPRSHPIEESTQRGLGSTLSQTAITQGCNKSQVSQMEMRKRSASKAAIGATDQPPTKQKRVENHSGILRPPRTWVPRCVFMVEHLRKHHLQFHNRNAAEGEKRNCGIFVSLADANCRVHDLMEDVVGEFWLNNDGGGDSAFDKGSDEYYGNPGYDGEKVGSSWEFDDWQSDVTHKVYVRAYPLAWPTRCQENPVDGLEGLWEIEGTKAGTNSNEMEWIGN